MNEAGLARVASAAALMLFALCWAAAAVAVVPIIQFTAPSSFPGGEAEEARVRATWAEGSCR